MEKVDGEKDQTLRTAINKAWADWKADKQKHAIFWKFIEAERNNLLKQYQFGVEPEHITVTNDGQVVTAQEQEVIADDDYFRLSVRGIERPINPYRPRPWQLVGCTGAEGDGKIGGSSGLQHPPNPNLQHGIWG